MQTRVCVRIVLSLAATLVAVVACDRIVADAEPPVAGLEPPERPVPDRPSREHAKLTAKALQDIAAKQDRGPLVAVVKSRSLQWRGKLDGDARTQAVKDVATAAKTCLRESIGDAGDRGSVRIALMFERDGTVATSGIDVVGDDPAIVTCLRNQLAVLYISPSYFKGTVRMSVSLDLSTIRVCSEPGARTSPTELNPYR